MAPSLTSTGLTIDTIAALQAQFLADMQTVYGQSINLGSDTPDGQMVGNFTQSAIDIEEWALQIFNSFDPDTAVGVVLDQRCAINNIQRQMGTYTQTNVLITLTATATLYGLDQSAHPVFTVTDNAGTVQWQLVNTVTKTAGSYELTFQSETIGPVLTVTGTITVPVTVVLAVSTINNDQTYLSLGTAQESDAQLKIRRQQATGLGSQGYYAALKAALQNISGVGVGNVQVYENDTNATSTGSAPVGVPSGIPSHSIWVVVGGGTASESSIGGSAGANALEIATSIYQKRNSGCGMLGNQTYAVTQPDGTLFPISWDTIVIQPVFIQFTVGSINGATFPNIGAIVDALTGLPGVFLPTVNQTLNVNQLITLVQQIDPNTYVSGTGTTYGFCKTSVSGTYTATLAATAGNYQYEVDTSKIVITPMIMRSSTSIVNITTGIPLSFTVTDNAIHTGGTGSSTLSFTSLGGDQGGGTVSPVFAVSGGGSFATATYSDGAWSATYTPRSSTGSDVLTCTDARGNVATVTVTVA